jgi:hypothetical protein
MADIPFSIGGHQILCPNWEKTKFEPASLEYQYLNGSLVYVGGPTITYIWDYLPTEEVVILRTLYNDLVTALNPLTGIGGVLNVTIPDYASGGLRMTTALMTEPTGTAGGDGSKEFSVTLYNLHESTFQTAMTAPQANLWDVVNNGGNLEIGSSSYRSTGWQF